MSGSPRSNQTLSWLLGGREAASVSVEFRQCFIYIWIYISVLQRGQRAFVWRALSLFPRQSGVYISALSLPTLSQLKSLLSSSVKPRSLALSSFSRPSALRLSVDLSLLTPPRARPPGPAPRRAPRVCVRCVGTRCLSVLAVGPTLQCVLLPSKYLEWLK